MIPLRDNIPSRGFPVVTYGIIAVNVVLFWYELQLGRHAEAFLENFGLVPIRFHSAHDPVARFLPIFTSMFLHAGLMHLVGNMLFLHIFGDNVEDRLGHLRFLVFYLGCGTIAALVQVNMLGHSGLPMIGASGAIAGVTGAYFVFYPRARILTLVPIFLFWEFVQVPAVVFLFLWFAIQIAYGMLAIGGSEAGGVAWWAHVGGFAGGAIGGLLIAPRRRPAARVWVD
jgi:membrane associated rhomboid family serine protease